MQVKHCRTCGDDKPLTQFHRDKTRADGLAKRCKACACGVVRRWREDNPEKAVASQDRRRADPAQWNEYQRTWRKDHPAQAQAAQRRHADKIKSAVLDHYGHTCACCGSIEHLGIDHINGDGKEHRALVGDVYRWLIANGFPGGFQTLCRACNASKGTGRRCNLAHSAMRTEVAA